MVQRVQPVVQRLWVTYGPALVLALLTAIGVLGGKIVSTWERQAQQMEAALQAVRRDLGDTKYRIVVLEVQLATARDDLRQRELHDTDQWRSIEALEGKRRRR